MKKDIALQSSFTDKKGAKVNPHKPKSVKNSFKKLIGYLKESRTKLIFATLLAAFAAIFSIIGPLFLGKITDELYISLLGDIPVNLKLISSIGIFLVVSYTISLIVNYFSGFIISGVSNKVSQKFRSEINNKINTLPLKYFDKVSIGDTLSRMTNDVDAVASTMAQTFSGFVNYTVRIIGIVTIMFMISWQLALISLFSLPATMFLSSLVIRKAKTYFLKQQQALGDINGFAEEAYSAHALIKVFDASENVKEDFKEKNNKLRFNSQRATFYSNLMQPLAAFISNLSYLAVVVIGAKLIFDGVIMIGAITSFVLYVRQLGRPVSQLVQSLGSFQTALAASERIFEILDEEEQEDEKGKKLAFRVKKVKGNVQFKDVVFAYEKDKPVINNFNLEVKAGQKIAIVGPTGAGKTTLINLLMRFYEIESGQILIDGVDTKTMKRSEVRTQFGMVLQDSWLFGASIKENLLYGTKNLSFEKVKQNCIKLGIDHFIMALPNGYDTIIDEVSNLSQGQKQLLTIARASNQNSPMLILDEATSSVDTRAEMLIQKAMDSLSKNRTSFVIAHRLSTIKNADKIIVMDNGLIVEVGTHGQLLSQGGHYAQLYKSQFEKV